MTVNWGNIQASQQSNFDILNFDTFDLPYDWASISHFRSKAYRTQKSVGHTIESKVSYFKARDSSNLTHYTLVSTEKAEYAPKMNTFGQKMMVKSDLHVQKLFLLIHRIAQIQNSKQITSFG